MNITKAEKDDFKHFCDLRKEGMKPHVEREGLIWDEDYENDYHRLMFDQGIKYGTLHRIIVDDKVVGYMGIAPVVSIGIWINKNYTGKGIGTEAINKVLKENRDKKFVLDVFKSSPAKKLYERLGFKYVSENEHFAYLERPRE